MTMHMSRAQGPPGWTAWQALAIDTLNVAHVPAAATPLIQLIHVS